MAPPHEKVFEPNSRLMDLFRRKSRMSQPSPGGAFKLPVMDVPDNPRHRIGSVLRIGRLSQVATFGHARRNPFFQLVSSNARNSFTGDRKSTRLNSSHITISYAVFCLKKKNKNLM